MEYNFLAKVTSDLTIQLPGGKPMQRVLAPFIEKEVFVEVTIRKHGRRRTDRQNRYIHGVVVPVVQLWSKETNGEKISHDECYYLLRQVVGDFLQIRELHGMDVITLSGKGFSKMTIEEFSDSIEKIKRYFSPKGCDIPDPTGENFLNSFL